MLHSSLSGSGNNTVSEEELFSAVVRERIHFTRGDGSAESFDSALKEALAVPPAPGRVFSYEDAAKSALEKLKGTQELTADEATAIYSQSFAAAQLDGNSNALFDALGETAAVSSMDAAIAKAHSVISTYDAGLAMAPARDLSETPSTGQITPNRPGSNDSIDGSRGFLYKAFSDIDGNALVIAPASMNGNVERVEIKDASGRLVETAMSGSMGWTNREYFRFQRSGSEYPKDIFVNFVLKSGGTESYKIPDSSLTWD